MNVIHHPCMDLVISSRDVAMLFDLSSSVHHQNAKCSNEHLSLLTNDLSDKIEMKHMARCGRNESNDISIEQFRSLTGLVYRFVLRVCFLHLQCSSFYLFIF